MIAIVVSWCIIALYAYLYGRVGISLVYKGKEETLNSIDVYIVCGIMILNLYSQVFSLFYKVGAAAFGILSVGAVVCVFYLQNASRKNIIKEIFGEIRLTKFKILFLAGIGLGTALWTNVVPQHYDTYLYHAQAIRWIEEYGVVPGLGNLHFRLAYNSAFMTLQALFSFSWLIGKSMHTVNGFIVLFMLAYFFISFHSSRKDVLQISDMLKLGALVYVFYSCFYISSPNTDMWVLLLLFYVCIKWSEFVEKKINSALPYAFLCVLCVYAITIKLSVAFFVFLAVYPATLLIQRKQWKQFWMQIAIGIVNVVPYFIRNVIISGYLVYPYPEINLFQFDWKMPEKVLLEDRKEIIAWGRGNRDISRYGEALWQWFPDWFMSIHLLWRVLFVCSVLIAIGLMIKLVKELYQRKRIAENVLIGTCIIGLIFWLLSAPLPRYGIVYMLFLPCIAIGAIVRALCKINTIWNRLGRYCLIGGMSMYCLFYFPYSYLQHWGNQSFIYQTDYDDRDAEPRKIGEGIVSVAVQGDLTGYNPFPTTPYIGTINGVKLRGEDFSSGFRSLNQ